MIPFFSSSFWALTVCDLHICIWKLSKFIFMEPPPFVHSGLQNTWVLEVKAVRSDFVVFNSGNINIKESKKPGFTFFSIWEPSLSDLMVLWHFVTFCIRTNLVGFCSVLYFCLGFFSIDTDDSQGKKETGGNRYSSLWLSPSQKYSDIYSHFLHLWWLPRIWNCSAWNYQTVTRWSLSTSENHHLIGY